MQERKPEPEKGQQCKLKLWFRVCNAQSPGFLNPSQTTLSGLGSRQGWGQGRYDFGIPLQLFIAKSTEAVPPITLRCLDYHSLQLGILPSLCIKFCRAMFLIAPVPISQTAHFVFVGFTNN